MKAIVVMMMMQAFVALETPAKPTRVQAEAAMEKITSVYRDASSMEFQLEIAQEPIGKYLIHSVHRRDFVWLRVDKDGASLYEAWAWNANMFPHPSIRQGVWMVVDKNYSVGGAMSAFEIEEESFHDGWSSENEENLFACFIHLNKRPIVGPRSSLAKWLDKLLGTRKDLLADREYMDVSECITFLLKDGYIGPDFPTDRILHCWRRKAGPARMGNEGTYVVTILLEGDQWVVLRRMTITGKDVTVRETLKLGPTRLVKSFDRDHGLDIPGVGRMRTWKFTYLEGPGSVP